MIKADKGFCKIEGDGYDVVFDIHQIMVCMANAAPEALLAAIHANTELLTEIMEDIDDVKLQKYSLIIKDIEEERSKLDDAN